MVSFAFNYGIRFYIGDFYGVIMQSATQENTIRGIRLRVNNTGREHTDEYRHDNTADFYIRINGSIVFSYRLGCQTG